MTKMFGSREILPWKVVKCRVEVTACHLRTEKMKEGILKIRG